ncbi:MAG: hypothetical protein K8I00_11325, partial [Candidatus Omnitrophica bacterium]|nr:hypothetical protein [Candidatus Omnitrophota bacterium]
SGQNAIFNTVLMRNSLGEAVTRTTGIIGVLSTADYHLQGVHFQVNGRHPVYDFKIKEGKFYGGQFKADIQIEAAGRMPYSGTVVLQDIPTGELNEALPDLEKDFQGVFSGDIYFVGDRNKLLTLEANLISQQDMLVRSALVGWIIEYYPISDDLVMKYLKDEIRKNPMMHFYQMEVAAQNKGQDLLKVQMRAKSRKHPINLNYNYDLRTDGDLLSTLQRLDGLLKKGLLGIVHAQQ